MTSHAQHSATLFLGRDVRREHGVRLSLIPCTDWAYNVHSVPFEQSKSAHYVPSL